MIARVRHAAALDSARSVLELPTLARVAAGLPAGAASGRERFADQVIEELNHVEEIVLTVVLDCLRDRQTGAVKPTKKESLLENTVAMGEVAAAGWRVVTAGRQGFCSNGTGVLTSRIYTFVLQTCYRH
jgi:hypothetical protein